MGASVYRDLDTEWAGNHWHGGIFRYFEYSSDGYGRMKYAEMDFEILDGDASRNREKTRYIGVDAYQITNVRNDLRARFYNGSYSINNISPNTRSSIANTAYQMGTNSIEYTWADMLDVNNVWCTDHVWWCEHWNGQISNIDELRCDGIAEYSYEKNNVIVSKTYSPYTGCSHSQNMDNIAYPSQSNVDAHNSMHDGDYNCGELCPKIQAGEDHSGSGTSRSYFDPLITADPVISNFSTTNYSTKIQLKVKIGDNASTKSYVLIEIKKSNESTYNVLKDEDGNVWKFKYVDLTDWNGSIQSDFFYIPWRGKYDGGSYSVGTLQLRI